MAQGNARRAKERIMLVTTKQGTGHLVAVDYETSTITLRGPQGQTWVADLPGLTPVHSRDWNSVHRILNHWINLAPEPKGE